MRHLEVVVLAFSADYMVGLDDGVVDDDMAGVDIHHHWGSAGCVVAYGCQVESVAFGNVLVVVQIRALAGTVDQDDGSGGCHNWLPGAVAC